MTETLEKIIFTLNLIDVHGEQDLSRMLGCIQELRRLKAAALSASGTEPDGQEE